MFPWYDSNWLSIYLHAQSIIKESNPKKLKTFTDALEPLKTRRDFEVVKIKKVFDEQRLNELKDVIKNLDMGQKETHEIFRFGRLVVHDHPIFNKLQGAMTEMVSEMVKEEVESSYNFLSLYYNLGVCDIHMDSPQAKWTLDICIEQTINWKIYISQRQDWMENFEYTGQNWKEQILNDSNNRFTAYSLKPSDGIIFSGSSQWHYRKSLYRKNKQNHCYLIFFHFIPKGMKEIIKPQNWAKLFDIPELENLFQ